MAGVEVEPRLVLPEEHSLCALFFSACKLLGEKECFFGIVISERDAHTAF